MNRFDARDPKERPSRPPSRDEVDTATAGEDEQPNWRKYAPWIIGALLLVPFLGTALSGPALPSITYSELVAAVGQGSVASVAIEPDGTLTGEREDGTTFSSTIPTALDTPELTALFEANDVDVTAKPDSFTFLELFASFAPILLLVGFFVWMTRRMRNQANPLQGMGNSQAKLITKERPDVGFADIAGYEATKQEVGEVIDYLLDPEKYRKVGATGPRGILLAGPPGTGKTLLARAVAGEAGVPFYSAAGSEFVEMIVGVGASRVRDLFKKARKNAPSIIFIDELDSIGRKRAGGNNIGSHGEQEQTLNQLLAEMDGFEQSSGVVVIAATNRAGLLDEALMRPGRFDRQVEVGLPTQPEREAILGVHTRGKPLADDVNIGVVARGTPGYSGAELKNLVNEAAILTVRGNRDLITAADFDEARDRILLGQKQDSHALRPEDRLRVAVHEGGHAIVAAALEKADPLAKVTIIPSGRALGVTFQLPVDDRKLMTQSWMEASLAVRMGGRVAEAIVLEEISSGAANDLAGATELARRMVQDFGMSDVLGPVGYAAAEAGGVRPGNYGPGFSDDTSRVVDEEMARVLREAEQRTHDTITTHRAALDQLIEQLLETDTVSGADVYAMVGRTPPDAVEKHDELTTAAEDAPTPERAAPPLPRSTGDPLPGPHDLPPPPGGNVHTAS